MVTTRRWIDRPAPRRGYWIRDEYGRLSWNTYPPFRQPETEPSPTTTPLIVWPPITTTIVQTEKMTESPLSTDPVLSSTSSPGTSSTLATWWKRTPAWRTVRGYWARDRWSGKMVWHTYTTGSSSVPTLFQHTSPSGIQTPVATSASIIQTLAQTTSSKTVPTTSDVTQQTLRDVSGTTERGFGEGRGEWRLDSDGKWIWYPSFDSTDQVAVQTSPWSVSATTPTTLPPTSTKSRTATTETVSATVSHRIRATTQRTPVRDHDSNRMNRTVTQPNILPSPSNITPLYESTPVRPSTKGNRVIFDDKTPTPTDQLRPSTVRPNATGKYADAWIQLIGKATRTPPYGESYN